MTPIVVALAFLVGLAAGALIAGADSRDRRTERERVGSIAPLGT